MSLQYSITPYFSGEPPYVWFEKIFSDRELDYLQSMTKLAEEPASLMSGENTSVRRTRVSWLYNSEKDSWLFEKLSDLVTNTNCRHYHFDLTGFYEAAQLTNYVSSDHGTYDWHTDRGPGPHRKLSIVVQLSDPCDYDGGELQLHHATHIETVRKQRGFVTIFPSYILHRVTPVTRGTRQSVVLWVHGPNFR